MNKLDIYFILVMCFINVTCGITLDPVKTSLSVENPISGSGQNNDPNNINNNLNIINRNEDLRKGETRYDDPPPEYYKGPIAYNRDRFSPYDAITNNQKRPLFPPGYENPYINKHFGIPSNRDKASVLGAVGGYNNYASDRSRPYGPPQAVDMPFGYKQHGYDWNGGGGGGGNSGHGLDWGHGGGYGGGGGSDFGSMLEEKFSYLSKSHLVPIAGIALLGIAAALIANPVLLQLGTMTGKRRRRRRDTSVSSPFSNRHRIYAHALAFNGYKKQQGN